MQSIGTSEPICHAGDENNLELHKHVGRKQECF